jgi:hypothetical protein
VLASDGPVSPARAAEIGLGMLGALKAAHRAGVLHRDVKPGNVLLGEDGRVVLTDFGLATVPGDPNVTRTGLVLGSPAYIAPERARDGTALPEGDLWSLGATLYAAVEGQSPFARPSAIGTLTALAAEPVPPPKNAGPLKSVLNGLLRKNPAERLDADAAERLLRRIGGRRARPGMSLLDRTRRPDPNGQRVERTRVVPAPLPAPRATGTEPPVSPAPAPGTERQTSPTPAPAPGRADPPTAVPAAVPAPRAVPATTPMDWTPVRGQASAVSGGHPKDSSDRRRIWLIGVLVAALLLALLAIVPLMNRDPAGEDPGTRPDAGSTTAPAPSGTPAASPSAVPTTPPPEKPTAAPQTGLPAPVIPEGWYLHKDPTGFSVLVPKGWTVRREPFYPYGREDIRVYFNDPNSARLLLIDQTTHPLDDAEADWRKQEAARKGRYRDYQRVVIQGVDYWREAADWEWLFTQDGTRMHVRNRGFVTARDKGYAIRWDTPAKDWDANLKNFDIIAAGFRPVRD